MNLLTNEIRERFPKMYETRNQGNPMFQVKFFMPWTTRRWYGVEFDGRDVFYGWVAEVVTEWGYFSLKELEHVRGPRGLRVERDAYFEPTPASEVEIRLSTN